MLPTELLSLQPGHLALFFALAALPILPNFVAIWHCFHRQFPTPQEKMIWFLLAIFLPVLGGLLYLAWGRKRGSKES